MKNKITQFFSCLLIFSFLFITSCSSEPGSYTINGNIQIKDGIKVYRVIADANNQPMIVDSTVVKGNKFTLDGSAVNPSISFLQVEGYAFNLPVVLEEGNIKVTINKDIVGSSKIHGTSSNDHFTDYKLETKEFAAAIEAIKSDIQLAAQDNNQQLIIDLQQDYKVVQQQIYDYELDFLKSNFDSYLSVILLERFLASKVISVDEVKDIYNQLTDRIKNSDIGKRLKTSLDNPNQPVEIGYNAPNFSGPTPDGSIIKMKDKLGKITILEFWASWCRPCRVENPNLVRTYNKFHPKGLEIIAISLDKNKPQWVQAIKDDHLTWNHVSNLQFWQDPIAMLYKVRAIPASFILDENGKIIAKNLRGYQLESKVSELLSSN